jgi:hypothetical protein
MASKRVNLCIITPDTLHGAFLNHISFPTFETCVIKGLQQLKSPAFIFKPQVFLLFASHFEPGEFQNLLDFLQQEYSSAPVFQVEGTGELSVKLVWPDAKELGGASESVAANSVKSLDSAIRSLELILSA